MTQAVQQSLVHQHRTNGKWELRTYQRGVKRFVSPCIDCGVTVSRTSKPVSGKRSAVSSQQREKPDEGVRVP